MTKWSSMKELKPISPEDYDGINYGYIVKVKSGERVGKQGIAVMFSRFGDIGVKTNFLEEPGELIGYDFREEPENLEILIKVPLTRLEWEAFQRQPSDYNGFDIIEKSDSPLFITNRKLNMLCYIFGQNVPFGSMEGMNIVGADKERNIYTGEASCADHLERCNFNVQWVAHPFQNIYEVNERNYAFKVRPKKEDPFFKNKFTLNSSFDDMIEHYIIHSLLEYNPNLPILGST